MPKKILITGAGGFVGSNLVAELGREPERYELMQADIDTDRERLLAYLSACDFVVHLAGVNRPKDESEFHSGNADLTQEILREMEASGNGVPVAITSSTQAELDNAYGRSKLAAEQSILEYGARNQVPVYVFRLPNVFGKWSRPNYNSAVATFCHNIANELPITVHDPERDMTLVYIDDVLALLKDAIHGATTPQADGYCAVPITYDIKLGAIADKIRAFHEIRRTHLVPQLTGVDKALYSMYLSYLPTDRFAYQPQRHGDERGFFAEFFKTGANGQFSVSTTKPGIVRGNHWHHTKVEKFLVVAGQAAIRFRQVGADEVVEYRVSGNEPTVVDIPPGYTHNMENTSDSETLVTVIWANELFDPERPDTYYLEV